MQQFYFHLWREGHLTPDEVGVALPTLKAAKRHAENMALSIIGQEACTLRTLSGWEIEVTDDAGRTMLIVPIGDGQDSPLNKRAA